MNSSSQNANDLQRETNLPSGSVPHACPANQPTQVHQLTPVLYAAYQVESGTVRLAGCTLDDVPVIRLEAGDPPGDRFFMVDGSPLTAELAGQLGLDQLQSLEKPPPTIRPQEVEQKLVPAIRRIEQQHLQTPDEQRKPTQIIWCKHASGKLTLAIGDHAETIAFDGWAQQLMDGSTCLPPLVCQHTGLQSYHVSATDQGIITVAEAIKRCAVSGERVLKTELHSCAATGRHVLERFLVSCEISTDRVLESEIRSCKWCHRQVNPTRLLRGKCEVCGRLARLPADDRQIVSLQKRFPNLQPWSKWFAATSPQHRLLKGVHWAKTILLVLDLDSDRIQFAALGNRFTGSFSPMSQHQRHQWLGDADSE